MILHILMKSDYSELYPRAYFVLRSIGLWHKCKILNSLVYHLSYIFVLGALVYWVYGISIWKYNLNRVFIPQHLLSIDHNNSLSTRELYPWFKFSCKCYNVVESADYISNYTGAGTYDKGTHSNCTFGKDVFVPSLFNMI